MSTLMNSLTPRPARADGISHSQFARLSRLVNLSRTSSPYYRELYRGLPDQLDSIRQLPVTRKKELMAHFDGWVTDPAITLEKASRFHSHPRLYWRAIPWEVSPGDHFRNDRRIGHFHHRFSRNSCQCQNQQACQTGLAWRRWIAETHAARSTSGGHHRGRRAFWIPLRHPLYGESLPVHEGPDEGLFGAHAHL